jgi:cytosine/creatinine deaminase
MAIDLVLRDARIAGREESVVDIAIADGRMVEIAAAIAADAAEQNVGGRLVVSGFVESHIHLDKTCILDRCRAEQGTLQEAIREVAAAKGAFTVDDIFARARRPLEKAIGQGTTRMRTHVEVDPRAGEKGFAAVRRLRRDCAWAIDIEICVFPQEGLLNDPGTEDLLDCRDRASAVAELAAPLFGLKRGRPSFTRPPVALHSPNS